MRCARVIVSKWEIGETGQKFKCKRKVGEGLQKRNLENGNYMCGQAE